ncbi:MAG: RNA-binding transcriptional accessory protein [Lachnospiraceae bacterium]|nr:RNA-binding transcriptional accessory protein [Lachnospiraceae bacterium]
MDIIKRISEELEIKASQVRAAVDLIDEGNTIPFIARYRKEATGSLNDEQLRALGERLTYLRGLEERKAAVLKSIEEQGKLTEELSAQIAAAQTLAEVEDLYRPYKQKRRTRATIAKEKGLEPLAQMILNQEHALPMQEEALAFVSEEKGVASAADALAGAKDIVAETVSDDAQVRSFIRRVTWEQGHLVVTAKDPEEKTVYETYYDYEEPLRKVPGHRTLAINRGEAEKILTVRVTAPEEEIARYLRAHLVKKDDAETAALLEEAAQDSYSRLIAPSIEREMRASLTETAQDGAIRVFGKNLEQLLMQPPIAGQTVLGWDPAFRTGCKLAVVDDTGKVLHTQVIYPTAPQNKVEESKRILKQIIAKYHVTLISVGNGTASRESEAIICDLLHEIGGGVSYVIVNEAGASVYSASALATEELPDFDVGQRSAASIARRIQDPLSELVKIDPKSIGVGQYQHDMDQKRLGDALEGVVERAVNRVGVDLNTASWPLLSYVAGISRPLAKNIVAYREANGAFRSRKELLKVAKLGPKAFEQCAGFLRIRGGSEPLDNTGVHPESYAVTEQLLKELGFEKKELKTGGLKELRSRALARPTLPKELGVGTLTLVDIIKELEKPGRDPREDMPRPVLRSDVMSLEDLTPGMILKGTVRNVIDFGAFVDIGVHQDGLVHVSQLSDRFVKHPLEVVKVGDIVQVKVLAVDLAKQRISLTMKGI